MIRADRKCERMRPNHPWRLHLCTCGQQATHVCSKVDVEFAVACEWHAYAWVRAA